MNDRAFDAISRRASLLTLTSAALSPLSAGPVAAAKKPTSDDTRCKRQKEQCRSTVKEHCASFPDPEACDDTLVPCCKDFKTCKADKAYVCILLGLASLDLES
jgi:hypothetical protein